MSAVSHAVGGGVGSGDRRSAATPQGLSRGPVLDPGAALPRGRDVGPRRGARAVASAGGTCMLASAFHDRLT